MDSIGERVRAARKESGYTMKQLHDLTGLSTGNISDIENGRNTPSVAAVVALGGALRCSLDWLLMGAEGAARSPERVPVCDGVPLSSIESDLVAMFRYLEGRDRETAFDFVTMLYEKATGEKGSIYSTYTEDERGEKSDPAEGREARGGIA